MPVTNTKVGLCQEALLLLASNPITSFDEGTDKARTCALLYETVIANVLTMRTWNFTKQKAELTRLVTVPTNGWKYQYQLPSDRIAAPWAVYNSAQVGAEPTADFAIYGDKLYSDDEVVVIDYQAEPDVSKFPHGFRTLVVYALAAAFAVPVTEQAELMAKYDALAFGVPSENRQGGQFRVAAQIDGKNKPPDRLQSNEFIAARFS